MSQLDFSPLVSFNTPDSPRTAHSPAEEGNPTTLDWHRSPALHPSESAEEDSPPASSSANPWNDTPVDAYADRLMDDIFTDIEHSIDSGAAPLEMEELEVLHIRPLSMPTLPAAIVPHMEPQPTDAAALMSTPDRTEGEALFDRILLGSVLVSCVVAVGWWLIQPDRYAPLLHPASTTAQVPAPPDNSANQQFADYLQHTLETLDKTADSSTKAPNTSASSVTPSIPASSSIATADLPTVTVPGTPTLSDLKPLPSNAVANAKTPASPGATALQKVYIPVYPNTPGLAAPPSNVAGLLPGVLNPAPPLRSAGNLPNMPVAAAPAVVPGKVSTPAKQPPGTAPALAPVPEATTVPHTLVGILELGDQSAALFQINGVTRRVNLGEAIGSGGWMLVDVNKQGALIRRNGEVRSIFVGEDF